MTPGINVAKKAKIAHQIHEYEPAPSSDSYGLEASEKLGIPAEQVFKTLVVRFSSCELGVAVIPVSSKLSMKQLAKVADVKKVTMAHPTDAERATGYVLGGVSPLGQKKRLKIVIDSSAKNYATIYVSAGRRGLEIELNPQDLKTLVNGEFANLTL